jgi:hypothetical protein
MASGTGGQIAVTRSNSLYLSVQSVDKWTNFVSESIEHTLNELEEGSITGNKDAPPSHKGIDFAQGDIQFEPDPNAFGHFMRGVFGQSSGTVLCEAGSLGTNSSQLGDGRPVIQHRFLPIQSAVDERNFLPAYTQMTYKDVGSAFFYQGVQYHGLEFQIQAGQLVKSTVTMMARKVERFARTSSISALTKIAGSKPWVWDMASVQVSSGQTGFANLVSNTNFESINLNLNIPLEGVVLLDGNKNYAEFQVNEFRRIQVSGTISFRSQAEYDAFVEYNNRSMRVTLRNVASQSLIGNPASAFYPTLQIDIPQFKFLTWSTPIGGPNRLITSFTGKAERDTTSLYMVEAFLTNVTSAY